MTRSSKKNGRSAGPHVLIGLGLFLLALTLSSYWEKPAAGRLAAVALLMAYWWITEAIPIPAASLLPLVLFPLLKIMPGKSVAGEYVNSAIFLFMGGFIIALALEKWNLHRRLALHVIRVIGSKPRRMILGFMVASAFLSMWISNTATTIMMLPIALSVLGRMEESAEKSGKAAERTGAILMLAVAYGASIGGMGTLIGTPPNLAFMRIHARLFPDAPEIGFFEWFSFATPASFLFLALAWALLVLLLPTERSGGGVSSSVAGDVISGELAALGPMSAEERRVMGVFLGAAALWMFRADIDVGRAFTVPGWAGLLGVSGYADDGTTAVFAALLLFIIPAKKRGRLMDWETALKLPWGVLLLFGGGFALAAGFAESGLSETLGRKVESLSFLHPALLVVAVSLLVTFLTELTSNTATAQIFLPILAAAAVSLGQPPLLLMIPATLSASCAFMLPVATPPNTIVFGSGRVPITLMARIGLALNLVGVAVVFLAVWFLFPAVVGF